MSFFSKLFGSKKTENKSEKEPVIINDEYGDFTLDEYSWEFEGDLNWCGEECTVWLETDDIEVTTAEKALLLLHKLFENAEEWDRKVKEYSAQHFETDNSMIEIWGSSENLGDNVAPVTKEEYLRRLKMSIIYIENNGEISFTLDVDDMFTDHALEVIANISGEMLSCGLQG